jgi:hypothetical protein
MLHNLAHNEPVTSRDPYCSVQTLTTYFEAVLGHVVWGSLQASIVDKAAVQGVGLGLITIYKLFNGPTLQSKQEQQKNWQGMIHTALTSSCAPALTTSKRVTLMVPKPNVCQAKRLCSCN